MAENLLSESWTDLDSHELRLLLNDHIKGPGQYSGYATNPNTLYLPRAGPDCRLVLAFRHKRIVAISRGPAFDPDQWQHICEEIETSILAGPWRVGREYSFSSFRVNGSWRGEHSGVQIVPPPDDAPRAPVEMAEHPLIVEFPIRETRRWPITNHRRIAEHRKLTHVLNVLLAGRTSHQPPRHEHLWARVPIEDDPFRVEWVQPWFNAPLGDCVIDHLSPAAGHRLEEVDIDEYFETAVHDGRGLCVPSDLDQSICHYLQLSPTNRVKFDRAAFWMDMASRLWTISISLSFASLVSAIEALTGRGTTHRVYCEECRKEREHEVPGATRSFKEFLERHAPGTALEKRRKEMYSLRSAILHGSELVTLDEDLAFGWDPPWHKERELYDELSRVTRVAFRNWLRSRS